MLKGVNFLMESIVTSSESEATAHLKSLKSMPLGGVWTPKCSGLPEDGSQNSGASRSSHNESISRESMGAGGVSMQPLDAVASLQMEKSDTLERVGTGLKLVFSHCTLQEPQTGIQLWYPSN